jgi:hypothetical protein
MKVPIALCFLSAEVMVGFICVKMTSTADTRPYPSMNRDGFAEIPLESSMGSGEY